MPPVATAATTATTTSYPTSSLSFFSSSLFSTKLPTTLSLPKRSPQTLTLTLISQITPLPILSFTGEVIGETFLHLASAPPSTARAVVHRGLITDLQNKRRGTASTLTRGEVRGGGRKPYPQKKTGRARRGSMRTPLRPGGGVVFGPKPKDWSVKINKKEKRLALSTAISSAAEGESVVCVEEFRERFEGAPPRTKEFVEAMRRWGLDPKEKVMFFFMEVSEKLELSSRNIGTLKMLTPRSLNLFDVLNCDKMVVTPEAVEYLNGRYGVDENEEEEDETESAEASAMEE